MPIATVVISFLLLISRIVFDGTGSGTVSRRFSISGMILITIKNSELSLKVYLGSIPFY